MRSPLDGEPGVTCDAPCHGYGATDWGVVEGTPVYAMYAGVVDTYWLNGGGNTLDLHGQGLRAHYAHLRGYTVPDGVQVVEGQLIAYSGNTGSLTSGPHLHVGLLNDGGGTVYVNGAIAGPCEYLNSIGYNWASGELIPIIEEDEDMGTSNISLIASAGAHAVVGGGEFIYLGTGHLEPTALLRDKSKALIEKARLIYGNASTGDGLSAAQWDAIYQAHRDFSILRGTFVDAMLT